MLSITDAIEGEGGPFGGRRAADVYRDNELIIDAIVREAETGDNTAIDADYIDLGISTDSAGDTSSEITGRGELLAHDEWFKTGDELVSVHGASQTRTEKSCGCCGDVAGGDDSGIMRCVTGGGGDGSEREECTMGDWARYEADRRRAQRKYGGGEKWYAGRTYVGAAEVAHSLVSSVPVAPLRKAAEHLERSLGRMEDSLCDPSDDGLWECLPPSALGRGSQSEYQASEREVSGGADLLTVPTLTSADVRDFLSDPGAASDPEKLDDLASDAGAVAAALGAPLDALPTYRPPGLPPLPARTVPVANDAAVLRLEAATVPYVAKLELYQASVANRLEATANVIDKALTKSQAKRLKNPI